MSDFLTRLNMTSFKDGSSPVASNSAIMASSSWRSAFNKPSSASGSHFDLSAEGSGTRSWINLVYWSVSGGASLRRQRTIGRQCEAIYALREGVPDPDPCTKADSHRTLKCF